MVKLKKKKAGGDKYRYTALIDTKYSMNNVDVGLHSNDKSAIKTLNGILKRKDPICKLKRKRSDLEIILNTIGRNIMKLNR